MPANQGVVESGLDRALQWALEHQLHASLDSGLWFDETAERTRVPLERQPWQRLVGDNGDRPGTGQPIIGQFWERLGGSAGPLLVRARGGSRSQAADEGTAVGRPRADLDAWERPSVKTLPKESADRELDLAAFRHKLTREDLARWRFRDNLTGVVMVHGIGPQLAGQTLLDWTQPIINVIRDATAADATLRIAERPALAPPDPVLRGIDDPVVRANIDFSGETFPVLQVRIPRRAGEKPDADTAPRWIFTETWWASEVRPPTLRTMVGWLGEQGGVGRIVQGIQKNTLGTGPLQRIAGVSVQPFVSVIVSFALLLLIAGLAITKLIPVESIRVAATLRLASLFLTDWFGGARTLLRDPAQSANVRNRLVMTIRALRAYGCRRVVIVAHSGGTIVSLTTLTDSAFPDLQVDKLITIGEALNLGWRLEAADPDAEHPVPPAGHRMRGNLAMTDRLLWRDFYGTSDPAACGAPDPPNPDPPNPDMKSNARFTTERVYNRMSVLGDHGGYWDNDEQFLIPLIREIDTPNEDRSQSRFYSDEVESFVRARRKERVSFLRLWRRATNVPPIMAILAAAILTSSGYLPAIGNATLGLLGSVPFSKELTAFGDSLADLATSWPGDAVYRFGVILIQAAFLLFVLQALIPSRVDGLWWTRRRARVGIFAIDMLLGPGVFLAIVVLWYVNVGSAHGPGSFVDLLAQSNTIPLVVAGVVLFLLARLGRWLRRELRNPQQRGGLPPNVIRTGAIALSAVFLGAVLLLLSVATLGVVLVYAGNAAIPTASATTRSFVVGAVAVLGLFTILQRLGEWRWDSWDARERQALRRNPLESPSRWWPTIVALLFTAVAFVGAILVATGTEGALLPLVDRETWLMIVAGATVVLIFVAIGKDVVDNDVGSDARLTGSTGSPSPYSVQPPAPGPGAGSAA